MGVWYDELITYTEKYSKYNRGKQYKYLFLSEINHAILLQQHSVLEWIWIKGSYLSQWLPQGERGPPKESKSQWIEILNGGSQ